MNALIHVGLLGLVILIDREKPTRVARESNSLKIEAIRAGLSPVQTIEVRDAVTLALQTFRLLTWRPTVYSSMSAEVTLPLLKCTFTPRSVVYQYTSTHHC